LYAEHKKNENTILAGNLQIFSSSTLATARFNSQSIRSEFCLLQASL